MGKKLRQAVVLAVVFAALTAGIRFLPLTLTDTGAAPHSGARSAVQGAAAHVVRVVDGDTIVVRTAGGAEERVRLIGVDTPESVHPDKSRDTPEGKVASDYAKAALSGRDVTVARHGRDRYGRTLATVYAGVESFNERLVRDGMARAYMTDRGGPYAAGILAAEAEARKDRAGFWGTGFFK